MNKNLINQLEKMDLKYKLVTVYNTSNGDKNGVMIDTNYDGPYAPKEVHNLHNAIEKIVKRYKGYKCEMRGSYTAMLIQEI